MSALPHHERLTAALHQAVGSGHWSAVRPLLAADIEMDTSNEAGRRIVRGVDAVLEQLGRPGPGTVEAWDVRAWPAGVALTFQWRNAAGADRRRWYVEVADGAMTRLTSYAARATQGTAAQAGVPEAVLSRVGAGARRAPLEHSGNSGAALERILLDDGTVLIAKRVGPASDWLGRVTGDRGRTALLHAAGAFARLDGVLEHGIVDVVPDGDGWWVVMRDLSATFLGDERRLSREESRRILDVAAAMHRAFDGDVPDGTATLEARLGMSSRAVATRERASTDLLPKQLEAAWDAFAASVDPELAETVLALADDPAPLAAALRKSGPVTLIHGDLRDDNLGLRDDGVVLLDWDLATAGTPTVEFAWYLMHDAWRIDAEHDELEADHLAAHRGDLPAEEVELGMLSGLVQYGWLLGHSARIHPDPAERRWADQELRWWTARARRALELLSGPPA